MTAIVPADFVRVKYRRQVYEPKLREEDKTENKALSTAKKDRNNEVDTAFLDEMKSLRFKPATMLPAYTQNTRVERVITSEDKEYRRLTRPTLFEQVEIQKGLAKQMLRDEINAAKAEEQKNKVRERLARLAAGANEDDLDEEEAKQEEEKAPVGGDQHHEGGDGDEETAGMDAEDEAEFKRIKLEQKEKRVLRTRNSHEYHFPVDKWRRRKHAFKLLMGLGGRSKGVTEVLPWILLGPKEEVMNQHHLIGMGVTHILNCTDDVQNEFPNSFVYMKVPIKDDEHQDILDRFPQVVAFFERVEEKRGKIFVHCTAGASRAPAMVAAYLVANRKISLIDTYEYLRAVRPIVAMNTHFLYHLAVLEMKQGMGCSILFHKDWLFYEFNMMKHEIDPKKDWREPQGVFETALVLYRKRVDDD